MFKKLFTFGYVSLFALCATHVDEVHILPIDEVLACKDCGDLLAMQKNAASSDLLAGCGCKSRCKGKNKDA
jgi:hypothetical protein